jgi:hypothetical protein
LGKGTVLRKGQIPERTPIPQMNKSEEKTFNGQDLIGQDNMSTGNSTDRMM